MRITGPLPCIQDTCIRTVCCFYLVIRCLRMQPHHLLYTLATLYGDHASPHMFDSTCSFQPLCGTTSGITDSRYMPLLTMSSWLTDGAGASQPRQCERSRQHRGRTQAVQVRASSTRVPSTTHVPPIAQQQCQSSSSARRPMLCVRCQPMRAPFSTPHGAELAAAQGPCCKTLPISNKKQHWTTTQTCPSQSFSSLFSSDYLG